MPEVNAGQHDLAITGATSRRDFVEHVGRRAAGDVAAGPGDDAEAAAEQTAVLHFDIGPAAAGELRDAGRNVDHAETAEQVGQFALVGQDLGHGGQAATSSGARVA